MTATTPGICRDAAALVRTIASDDVRTAVTMLQTMDRGELIRVANVVAAVAIDAAQKSDAGMADMREWLAEYGFDLPDLDV